MADSSEKPLLGIDKVKEEIETLQREIDVFPSCPFKLELVREDPPIEVKGTITGPPWTPYEGGNFHVEFLLGKQSEYPVLSVPHIRFLTPIWHPNMSLEPELPTSPGYKVVTYWDPETAMRGTLSSFQQLLASPTLSDLQDDMVMYQFNEHPDIFYKTAAHWTALYAGGTNLNPEYEATTKTLVDMGIDNHSALITLSKVNWDLEQAINSYFG